MPRDVLVVDDNEDLRDVLMLLLEQQGFNVRTADNGRDALAILHSGFRPAVIVLDLMMPQMSGVEFRAVQRQDETIADIPVIAVTAAGIPTVQQAHADVEFAKPVDFDALVTVVSTFCAGGPRPSDEL